MSVAFLCTSFFKLVVFMALYRTLKVSVDQTSMLTTDLRNLRDRGSREATQFTSPVVFYSSYVIIKVDIWRSTRPRLAKCVALYQPKLIFHSIVVKRPSCALNSACLIQGQRRQRRCCNPCEHSLKTLSGVTRCGQMIWLKGWWWVVIKGQLLAMTSKDGSSSPSRRNLQQSLGVVMRGVWRRWFSSQHYKRYSGDLFDQHSNSFFLLPTSNINLWLVSCSLYLFHTFF